MRGIQRVCHQLRTAGYAEERCEKSELANKESLERPRVQGSALVLLIQFIFLPDQCDFRDD